MPSRGLSLQERDAVLTAAETPPDEARFGSRVATLYDARSRLTAGRIHVERIRAFSSSTERDPRMDAELMDLDDALRGLAIRITDERVRGMLSRRAFVGARYAERTVPRLYEYWLEAVAAKRHQETE